MAGWITVIIMLFSPAGAWAETELGKNQKYGFRYFSKEASCEEYF